MDRLDLCQTLCGKYCVPSVLFFQAFPGPDGSLSVSFGCEHCIEPGSVAMNPPSQAQEEGEGPGSVGSQEGDGQVCTRLQLQSKPSKSQFTTRRPHVQPDPPTMRTL